ncbi:hypothetical protein [Streptomyces sp. NPDC017958]|uniref:hypothetical protein n=1 Tax=Streptomyces sp. NPDC017958 TaxID=3365021 RepID=UPI0037A3B8CA
MREIAEAALRFPTVTFTAVLVLVIGFWALILLDPSRLHRAVHRVDADPERVCTNPISRFEADRLFTFV